MLATYVFCLVLAGGFLLVSILGDALGGDVGDLELEGGFDLEGSLDADLDLSGGGTDVDLAGAGEVDAGSGDLQTSRIFSFRTVIYALFGFGAVGTSLTLLGSGTFLSTLLFAALGGLLSGGLVAVIFRYLASTDSGAVGDRALLGATGVVTLPLGDGTPGAIAVDAGGQRVPLRALPHAGAPDRDPSTWRTVVVVDIVDGVARVAPVEEDLTLDS
jgi:hypothetical protein